MKLITTHDINAVLPMNTRTARNMAGMTRRQMADSIGIKYSRYCKYEERIQPSVDVCLAICRLAGISLQDYLTTSLEPVLSASQIKALIPKTPHVRKTIEQRFWAKVDKTPGHGPNGDCWMWIGGLNAGYGIFSINGKPIVASRMSHKIHHGEIPNGLFVLHSCDNPSCVNPAHLRAGTNQDNVNDMIARGRDGNRKKTHCPRGHEYAGENLRVVPKGRQCKACSREHKKRYRAKKKAVA